MPRISFVRPIFKRMPATEQIILAGVALITPLLLFIEENSHIASLLYINFRIAISVIAAIFFLASYIFPFVYKNLTQITIAFLYVLVSHAIFLTYVNNFSYYYASFLMSIVILSSFYFSGWKQLLVFQFCMLLILIQASVLAISTVVNIAIFLTFYFVMNVIVFMIQLYIFNKNAKLYQLTSELETTARDLEKTNRSLEQFAYIASHDLKEPLRTVNSYLQLLKRDYGNQLGEDADNYIAMATGAGKRMYALIEGLLKYSKTGSEQMELQEVNLNEVVENVLNNLDSSIGETKANIAVAKMPVLKGDKIQLLQLFQNLISNALKYRSLRAPFIQIEHEVKGGHCLICIEDNGLGIPQDQQASVFKIFNRFHTEITDGVGIGLALCKKIVTNHKGDIWVESEEGKGSRFYFTLQMNS